MLVIETITGNIHEAAWKARLEHATLDWLALDQWEAQKSRLRKLSQNGIDLAISLPRGILLRDGDVLVWDEARQAATVARVTLKEVMVVELGALQTQTPEVFVRTVCGARPCPGQPALACCRQRESSVYSAHGGQKSHGLCDEDARLSRDHL